MITAMANDTWARRMAIVHQNDHEDGASVDHIQLLLETAGEMKCSKLKVLLARATEMLFALDDEVRNSVTSDEFLQKCLAELEK